MADSNEDQAITQAARWVVAEVLYQADEGAMSAHPEIDRIVAYQEGGLDPAAGEQIRRHLEQCAFCREELVGLEAFDLAAAETDPERAPSPEITRQDWRRLQESLADQGRKPAGEPWRRTPPERPPSSIHRSLAGWALAAALVVVAIGLAVILPRPDGETGGPGRHPLLLNLIPDGEIAVRAAANAAYEISRRVDVVVIQLGLRDLNAYVECGAEIRDASGELIWQAWDLERQPDGRFVLLVPRRVLPEGPVQIRLLAKVDGSMRPLATYSIELRPAED